MLLLKIAAQEWKNASRDKRELSVCRELGADVTVMAKGGPKDWFREDQVAGFNVLRFSTKPLGVRFPNALNRFVALFTWARAAKKLTPDIISGHDIIGLTIGWISTWFVPKAKKPKLVYDSHEFEIGRNAERNHLTVLLIARLERFLMKRCAFSIMVNDSIADEVQKIHQLKDRPVVVRNVAPLWGRDDVACAEVRHTLCQELNISEDIFIVMYHGGIMVNRGIENMLRAIALTPGIAGVVLGNGDAAYIDALKRQATELGIAERVLFHNAVPIEILKDYVGAVDCGLITIPNACVSYYYMLPNKLFENIQSETPVVGSNVPEVSRLINQYQFGLLCDPANPEEIAKCIKKMRDDNGFYQNCKNNTKIAKQELCWEKERMVLKKAYESIIHG